MNDHDCIDFLRWALPRLRLRWDGFRKVRRQVCKRVQRRMRALEIDTIDGYCRHLESQADEWDVLDTLCHIGISRFYRDLGVFDYLHTSVLPALARRAARRKAQRIRVWSAGCGSGEEPYSIAIVWRLALRTQFPSVTLEVVATDADATLLRRAAQARYGFSSTKELPEAWRETAFERKDNVFELKAPYRAHVDLRQEDIRRTMPCGPFDLVLCRNLAFTYFETNLQIEIMHRLTERIRARGALVIGHHERLPESTAHLALWSEKHCIYRKIA